MKIFSLSQAAHVRSRSSFSSLHWRVVVFVLRVLGDRHQPISCPVQHVPFLLDAWSLKCKLRGSDWNECDKIGHDQRVELGFSCAAGGERGGSRADRSSKRRERRSPSSPRKARVPRMRFLRDSRDRHHHSSSSSSSSDAELQRRI